jgi:hypothetical protein
MQDNPLQNNPMAFWAGLVLIFVGLAGVIFYLFVRTASESLIFPGNHFRLKHFIVSLLILAAGAVIASFARPRPESMPTGNNFNR